MKCICNGTLTELLNIKHACRFILITLFLCLFQQITQARNNWDQSFNSVSTIISGDEVIIRMKFRQGDNKFGPVDEDGYIESMTVSDNNGRTLFTTNAGGCNANEQIEQTLSGADFRRRGWKSSDRYYWLEVDWHIKTEDLNVTTIRVSGTWDVNGIYGTDAISGSYSVDIPELRPLTINSSALNLSNKYTTISFSKSGSNSDIENKGSYKLYYANTNDLVPSSSVSGSTITIRTIEQSTKRYELRHEYLANGGNLDFTVKSNEIKVPALSLPTDPKASFDDVERVVNVSFAMSSLQGSAGQDYLTDNLIVEKSLKDSNLWSLIGTIDYDPSKILYTIQDNSFEGATTKNTYTYRMRRNRGSTWYDWMGVSTDIYISTDHKDLLKAPTVIYDKVEHQATITWDTQGDLWSKGSQFVLSRINRTTNSKEDFILKEEDLDRGNYSDKMINTCNRYYYELKVVPGGLYNVSNSLFTGEIFPQDIGDLSTLEVSKGYFSDRTEMRWTSKGPFQGFIIQRREHNSSNDFKQISDVTASLALEEYLYTDYSGQAGILYDYRILGTVNCADSALYANPLTDLGFRTPSGDIYGRVTFENGQAEEGVEINVTTEAEISSQSLSFRALGMATVNNGNLLLENTDSITVQAYVSPDATDGTILSKVGMYELGIQSDAYYFTAGGKTVIVTDENLKASVLKANSAWVHLTGVYTGSKTQIYINGNFISEVIGSTTITGNTNQLKLGDNNFKGKVDEVRIWNIPLSEETIKRDYNRYITGDETGLIAYYNFNYATTNEFYDTSFSGSRYNANHGRQSDVFISSNTPTEEQLGYKVVTRLDGSYEVRSIPYVGNGTAYYIVPTLGIHRFESEKEIRFISEQAQSHTVNFIDKSSFTVSGIITYTNSIIPVEGVNFTVDGKTVVKSNGIPETTMADGTFSIMVPVGIHEVKAVKPYHVFENDGKVTNSSGQNLNYQDDRSNVLLKDSTTVKYIGRVSGGSVQEAYPLGHSLSINNLADDITVTLKHLKVETLSYNDSLSVESHFKPSKATNSHTNLVEYINNEVVIHVNDTTGEFVANVIPEQFTVKVNAGTHHVDIPGSGGSINLTQQFIDQSVRNEYVDSTEVDGVMEYQQYSDTVFYNFAQKFIKRYEPEIRVNQVNGSGNVLPYFGNDTVLIPNMLQEEVKVPLYNSESDSYTFEKPVYVQDQSYKIKLEVFEKYAHYSGDVISSTDEVPTQDAIFKFNNELANNDNKDAEVVADSVGVAFYTFSGSDPEITSGIRTMNLKVTYGDDAAPTSIDWEHPVFFTNGEAYVLGAHQTGTDFVTAGPDKVLSVLRDPPGSNSYAYLEKGISFEESSTYTGSIKNSGNEDFTLGVKAEIVTWTGVGAGVILKTLETSSGATVGIIHEEEYQGQDTKKTTTKTTTRFQTSADPYFVGADADLYIGYSTNISFGSTQNVTIVPLSKLDAYTGTHYKKVGDWAIVYAEGRSMSQSFNTLFAYPQIHIEEKLIPQFENIRNDILKESMGFSIAELQAAADAQGKVFYYSYLPESSPDFGKVNEDESILDKTLGDADDIFDGPSYKIIYPTNNPSLSVADTIVYLNQSVEQWKARMADNEKAKVEATLLQNYSFHGGSNVDYSESYSTTKSHQSTFYVNIGGKISNDSQIGSGTGPKTKFSFSESIETKHGGTFTSETSAEHSKGFVLAEDGGIDYLSVDVCYEAGYSKGDEEYETDGNGGFVEESNIINKSYYPSFIFKTKAGSTSCPHEEAYVTRFFEPGQHLISEATKRIEVPEIDMEVKYVENVPSGENAQLKLYLRNNSESYDDVVFDLKTIEASNPDGAKFSIDGSGIGNGRTFLVPAGETLIKTLEVGKGRALNYDDLQLILQSQCQYDPTDSHTDIADTLTFTVHFIPSCTDVSISKPNNNWTYNTKLPTTKVDGIDKHYMEVIMDEFNVNYDNFGWIALQYKSASQSDDDWVNLMSYYNDSTRFNEAIENGFNAKMIDAVDAGVIRYNFFMDDLPDQRYDLRAVSVCVINNEEVQNTSESHSGIKDMYNPRLFGVAQPANGILTINDEIRLNFNETIADGLLTINNFQVTGIRNGAITDHSVAIHLDGDNDFMASEVERNMSSKNITAELWVKIDEYQDATLLSQGNINESIELAITKDKYIEVTIGNSIIKSSNTVPLELGSWAHIALQYDNEGYVSAFFNYQEVISMAPINYYNGIGNLILGKSISTGTNFLKGQIDNVRIWDDLLSSRELQLNSLAQLSGNETSLMAYYPIEEARGTLTQDKARGATLVLDGCIWSTPEGRAVSFDGSNDKLQINTGSSAVIDETMDYTLEFWFSADPNQSNATMLSNGRGDGTDLGGSKNLFAVGFESGKLTYQNNAYKSIVEGNYMDNKWHHFTIAVNRTFGRAQIIIDGEVKSFFDANEIGGIASAHMNLGARLWTPEGQATLSNEDQYFKGKIDELRIWNLYRNEDIISATNNIQLIGDEMGLLAYYPFEHYINWQGNQELQFSLEDQRVQSNDNASVPAAINYGAVEITDIPSVKGRGPVSNLNYNFVVNDDALIISLEEPLSRIENSIITFTVDGIRDINGNENISPIIWTAYIDRNQLVWSETSLNISQKVNSSTKFEVLAVNNGGTVQKFNVDNIPAWLNVTPSKGSINPNSSETLQFEIHEGLNVGTYDEVVYLVNSENVSEPLELIVTVTSEQPDWNINPAEYKYNMSVFGKLRFNNIYSSDEGDLIAAFRDGKCIGVTASKYNRDLEAWYVMLTLYSNSITFDDVEFRMWDSSTGITYLADPGRTINFANNSVVGSLDDLVIFDAKDLVYQNIHLLEGWNWISFNVATERLNSIDKALSNMVWNTSSFFKSELDNISANYSVAESRWVIEKPLELGNKTMYKLSTDKVQTINLLGEKVLPSSNSINVNAEEWNYISYVPTVRLTIEEALASYDAQINDVIKSQYGFAMYTNSVGWVGNLTYLEPGVGYMLFRNGSNSTSFVYPNNQGSLSVKNTKLDMIKDVYVSNQYPTNMNMVAIANIPLFLDDKIITYLNGEVNSTSTVQDINGELMSFITTSGNKNEDIKYALERNGETIAYSVTKDSYKSNSVTGSIDQPLVIHFEDEIIEGVEVKVYPNPIESVVTIDIDQDNIETVDVRILNIASQTMIHKEFTLKQEHRFISTIDCKDLQPGIYFVVVKVNGIRTVTKVKKI
ncbi:LamG-like jellyroll fold domain-containing protein [Saccharicrinis aurantiacus]|uniref:LamG-like jellyroll fold domain-containing protein n=1 Tax=Saccharicrinis aurantiacus TaxID=1849719 RepID=UPI002490D35F|nr:LamG-like jellyroll fold domain-containing protein [Saccharicrinis aurantiacus]